MFDRSLLRQCLLHWVISEGSAMCYNEVFGLPEESQGSAGKNTEVLCLRPASPLHFFFFPCTSSFVFLCQVSLTNDALVLADNILFKQMCRLKDCSSKTTIKLALARLDKLQMKKCLQQYYFTVSCPFTPWLLYLFKSSHKKGLTEGVLLLK